MKRRSFIAGLAGAMALPVAARGQQSAMPVVGFLGGTSLDGFTERLRSFHQGLREVGYVEGENVAIEFRWAENQLDRLPVLAGDLVRKRVSVIVATGGTVPAIAAKAATATIPIVFAIGEGRGSVERQTKLSGETAEPETEIFWGSRAIRRMPA